ncbi:sulfite exporter TauE/SafE family protein [Thioclava sp. BHET1]|nr:sulfite exporter TauE/SafE family protein [Thioclava sp. BHET1]
MFHTLLPLIAMMIAAGAASGFISGLLGVGGGIILVPAFYYAFSALGYHPDQLLQICVATSTGTIIFTSLRSVLAQHKRGAVSMDIIRSRELFIAIGALFGVLVATLLRSAELGIIFGTIGLCIGLYMLLGKRHWRLSSELPNRWLGRTYGTVIGFLSALMGIGGGSFTVPLLTAYNLPPHRAVGTSPGFGLIISIPAFVAFLLSGWHIAGKPPFTIGYVNLPAVGLIVITAMMTVPLGVRVGHTLSPAQLRIVFAVTVLVLASNVLREALMG